MKIDIKGSVVDSETGQMFDWFGMQNTNPKDIQNSLDQANGEDIELNISSGGGDVAAAAEIYTMLKQYPGKVTGTIQGIAASAASVISEACDHLVISPAASMMIHRASAMVDGNTHDMEHHSIVLSKIDQTICSVYQAKTGKSRDDILDLMEKETWMTADEAVNQGFADEVLSVSNLTPQLVNSYDPIPIKSKVDEFMHMMMGSQEKQNNNSQKSDITNSKSEKTSNTALFDKKLSILKGEKND